MATIALTASPTFMFPVLPPLSSSKYPFYSSNRITFRNLTSPILSFNFNPIFKYKPLRCSATPYSFRSPVVSMSSRDSSEPLWKSLQKSMQNIGKKPSIEDVLKQQIEKREYYDGGGGGDRSGGRGGGGGDGFGESDEEGFSGIMDETFQVIMATLGFIFLYVYIINGAEMTRLAKDFIMYMFGGRKSIRLTRLLDQWEGFCKRLSTKEVVDRFWLEKAIINTPTWWDHPDKYKLLLKAYFQSQSRPQADDDNEEIRSGPDDSNDEVSDEYPYGLP